MPRFTGFSKKYFLKKKKKSEIWVKYGQCGYCFKLDSTDCSMRVSERLEFKVI